MFLTKNKQSKNQSKTVHFSSFCVTQRHTDRPTRASHRTSFCSLKISTNIDQYYTILEKYLKMSCNIGQYLTSSFAMEPYPKLFIHSIRILLSQNFLCDPETQIPRDLHTYPHVRVLERAFAR